MTKPETVLVLCTGNSCCSQMGEAILNHDLAGLPAASLQPKTVDAVIDQEINLVVSVCDNAREACPVFPRPVKRIHVRFHAPHCEPLASFVAVRDDIRARLVPGVRAVLGLGAG
jgi:arsenate reductase